LIENHLRNIRIQGKSCREVQNSTNSAKKKIMWDYVLCTQCFDLPPAGLFMAALLTVGGGGAKNGLGAEANGALTAGA
jgi:hypothetical protein